MQVYAPTTNLTYIHINFILSYEASLFSLQWFPLSLNLPSHLKYMMKLHFPSFPPSFFCLFILIFVFFCNNWNILIWGELSEIFSQSTQFLLFFNEKKLFFTSYASFVITHYLTYKILFILISHALNCDICSYNTLVMLELLFLNWLIPRY